MNSAITSELPASDSNHPMLVVDWGTSSFRLWSLSADGEVIGRSAGPDGMSTLDNADYARVLDRHMAELNMPANCPVVICGMAGAAQGWHEAPYMATTEDLFSLGRHAVRVPGLKRNVHILPGVKQSMPANVMRGEETQILGLLATQPDYEGVVCLPGTHTKWVRINNGYIERFTTCMTGELFALLAEQSVLKHTVASGWDNAAFDSAVNDVIDRPESMATSLFSLRASALLDNVSPGIARARLSGLLIGYELAATRAYWGTGNLSLIGEPSLCQNYEKALALQQVYSSCLNAESLTLTGLSTAYKQIEEHHHGV